MNRATLLGNAGQDPTIRTMPTSGKDVASFSLATTERWKDREGAWQEKTEWHRVVVFGALVNVVKGYIVKGSKLLIEGKLQTRKWTDASEIERYVTEVVVDGPQARIELLTPKAQQAAGPQNGTAPAQRTQAPAAKTAAKPAPARKPPLDDDIPF